MDHIEESFAVAVQWIYGCRGRVIVTGIGKSGIVGRKIVATLSSTGTPALFLHPVEAMHGDLGMIRGEDIVLALSNSGETTELNVILPSLRNIGTRIISFTGKTDSTLARHSDLAIYAGVPREACPMGLAPTASTTAMLALGDALAVALIKLRNFQERDFHRYRPGGVFRGEAGRAHLRSDAPGRRHTVRARRHAGFGGLERDEPKGNGSHPGPGEKGRASGDLHRRGCAAHLESALRRAGNPHAGSHVPQASGLFR